MWSMWARLRPVYIHDSAPISMDCQLLSKMTQFVVEQLLVPLNVISIYVGECYLNNIVANLVIGELNEICVIKEQ